MLKDLLGRTDLASWPSAALVIFVAFFVAVVARAVFARRGGGGEDDRMRALPLDDAELEGAGGAGRGGR